MRLTLLSRHRCEKSLERNRCDVAGNAETLVGSEVLDMVERDDIGANTAAAGCLGEPKGLGLAVRYSGRAALHMQKEERRYPVARFDVPHGESLLPLRSEVGL